MWSELVKQNYQTGKKRSRREQKEWAGDNRRMDRHATERIMRMKLCKDCANRGKKNNCKLYTSLSNYAEKCKDFKPVEKSNKKEMIERDKEVIYIAELDADVDDVIAAEYLYRKGVLKEVVCDPKPRTEEGRERKKQLEEIGVKVSNKIPPIAKYVFVGGALTELAGYLINHKIEYLVMNGGFVGCNIVQNPLEKFKGKQSVRTFNFNCDVKETDFVLRSRNVRNIILVGKNVCHDEINTLNGIWSEERELLEKYHSKPDKRQHDMLACREGLILLGLLDQKSYLKYAEVRPYNTGLKGNMTEWGSTVGKSPYKNVLAAIDWSDILLKRED